MAKDGLQGIQGWLLVYLIGSIPPMLVYSMGLSGWFFEYPVGLMVGVFLVFAVPLLLVLTKSPKAPRWNVAVLWIMAVLMTLRSASVILMPSNAWEPMSREELQGVVGILSAIVGFSLAWAIVWTMYFKTSVRVRNTFGRA